MESESTRRRPQRQSPARDWARAAAASAASAAPRRPATARWPAAPHGGAARENRSSPDTSGADGVNAEDW